jgi:nitrogen-specific signal transduction histidine kinase
MRHARHPVIEHLDFVLIAVFVALTLIASGLINKHSVAWLIDIYLTLGLLLFSARSARKSPLHQAYTLYLFLLLLYLINVWFLHAWIPGPDPAKTKSQVAVVARILRVGSIFMSVGLLHFTVRFARVQSRVLRATELIGWVIAAGFYLTNLAGLFASDYTWATYTWVPKFQGIYHWFFYFTAIFVSLGLFIPIYQVIRLKEKSPRLQLLYFTIGAFPLWLSCLGNFLLSMGINIYPAGGLIFLFHVAIVAYSVLAKQLFDFTISIRRGLAYALMSLVIGMGYAAITYLLFDAAWPEQQKSNLVFTVTFFVLVGILQSPLLSTCQRQVDRWLYRNDSDRRALLEKFAKEIASDIELRSVLRKLALLLHAVLNPRDIRIYINDSRGRALLYGDVTGGVFNDAQWPSTEPLTASDEYSDQHEEMIRPGVRFVESGQALQSPLLAGHESIGVILLGPKLSDTAYLDDDRTFVEAICAQSSIAIINARSYAELIEVQSLNKASLNGLSAGVALFNQSGVISQSNPAFAKICGCGVSPETLADVYSVQSILSGPFEQAVQDGTDTSNCELQLDDKHSTTVLLSIRCVGERHGKPLFVAIIYDISQYKHLEEISRRKEQLAKVGEAIAAINHELKNILQPIKYQINKLSATSSDDPIVRHVAQVVPERIQALDRLLQNLKDLARPIDLTLQEVNLQDLAESVWRDVMMTVGSAGHVVYTGNFDDTARYCQVDGQWFRLVLFNLFRNAVEAMASTSHPRLEVFVEMNLGAILISIVDNGCGISHSLQTRLFEPFFSTKGQSGTGLGLSICKKIVELHSGNLLLKSDAGKGTRVEIRLPYHESRSFASKLTVS